MTDRGRFQTHADLVTRLSSQITGGNYWNDFSSIGVYDQLVLPGDGQEMPEVYVCVPFMGDTETIQTHERGASAKWEQTIFGFVRRTVEHPTDSDLPALVGKLRDDLVRFALSEPTLNSRVHALHIIGVACTAGVGGEFDYGEVQMKLEITQHFGAADLGPSA